MKTVTGYVGEVDFFEIGTKYGTKSKCAITVNNLKIGFWVKKGWEPPKVGQCIEIEYEQSSDYLNADQGTKDNPKPGWVISRNEPKETPPPTAKDGEDKWANLTAKDQIMARMNATNNATALVAAQIQAGLLKDNLPETTETWFQFILNLLYHGPAITNKTEIDIAMEAALAWAVNHNIDPQTLDKFIQGYKTSHNLITREVLTLINQGKIEVSEVLDDIPF